MKPNEEYSWLQAEAAKVQRKARKFGTVTVVLDTEGCFHVLPGVVEIIGTYDSTVKAGALVEDLRVLL